MKFEPHIPNTFNSIKTYVSNGSRNAQNKWVFQSSHLRCIALRGCLYFTNADRYMSELVCEQFLSDLGSYYISYKDILKRTKKPVFLRKMFASFQMSN